MQTHNSNLILNWSWQVVLIRTYLTFFYDITSISYQAGALQANVAQSILSAHLSAFLLCMFQFYSNSFCEPCFCTVYGRCAIYIQPIFRGNAQWLLPSWSSTIGRTQLYSSIHLNILLTVRLSNWIYHHQHGPGFYRMFQGISTPIFRIQWSESMILIGQVSGLRER